MRRLLLPAAAVGLLAIGAGTVGALTPRPRLEVATALPEPLEPEGVASGIGVPA